MDQHNETIIAQGTVMKGSIASEVPVTVSGKVDGDLAAPTLNISETGSVHGQVLVENLMSKGEISGEIEAQEVNLSGKVRDKTSIKAKSLEVKLDTSDPERLTVTFGECTLDVGQTEKRESDYHMSDQEAESDEENV
ncbi:polymer-forming cytoskeletal protein [bacterium]|nr:polymer-forming cytoskeletal protein [bacterium]